MMTEKVDHFAPAVARKCRFWILWILLLVGPFLSPHPAAADTFEDGIESYRQNDLPLAKEQFEAALLESPDDPEILAYLAHATLRLRDLDSAVELARRALELDPCCTHAHLVLDRAYNPMFSPWPKAHVDSSWVHVNQGLQCDSTDGSFWLSAWTQAMESGRSDIEHQALRALYETRFFTPTMLAYTRWALRGVPDNAILLTNGDMDTYPALALQEGEDFRSDLAVVNMSLLQVPWYVEHVCRQYGLPLPWENVTKQSLAPRRNAVGELVYGNYRVLHAWLDKQEEGNLDRTVAVALTVPLLSQGGQRHLRTADLDRRTFAGSYWYFLPGDYRGKLDEPEVKESLAAVDASDFLGPWTSERDRSPVRIASTPLLRDNLVQVAFRYAGFLKDQDRLEEALDVVSWARDFNDASGGDPEKFEEMRRLIMGETVQPESSTVDG